MKNALKRIALVLGVGILLGSCSNVIGGGTKGPDGEPGSKGPDGPSGSDASGAYEAYTSLHPEYSGDVEQWMDDLVNGRLGGGSDTSGFVFLECGENELALYRSFSSELDIVVPDAVDGKKVTTIWNDAFSFTCPRTITLGPNVKTIRESAFEYCYELVEVKGCEGLEYIENGGFNNCQKLKKFPFCEPLKYIGTWAFADTALTEVLLPKTVSYIGEDALYRTTYLNSFIFPECGADTVIESPFRHITADYEKSLTKIVLPEGLEAVCANFASQCANLVDLTIPSTVKTIGSGAFSNTGLVDVALPDGLEYIEGNAFESTKLAEIALPSSVKSVGTLAFASCNDLSTIVVKEGVEEIKSNAFFVCNSLTEIYLPKNLILGVSPFSSTNPLAIHVYCADESKPDQWDAGWDNGIPGATITWGYQG